ncbi:MFS general substrate transporter [Kockovaella imperatae]|uniref:MFS general substrate transporter n=1 Tax=Kockovaella imperatae TaxID=4999 RepID=A0A1Y1UNA4_9TREE|nr:MFS general substrate transporter [Kockovaella imperatae]ORX39540.1 MFS general substrate transporter [Kockovaella imperatae]
MGAEQEVECVEDKRPIPPDDDELAAIDIVSPSEEVEKAKERRLLWKLDAVILPMTVLLYLSANLDRGNIGNARLQGLQKELLDNKDERYSVVLLSFYITYMLGSIPGTLLSKAIPPNYAIGSGCLIWYSFRAVAASAMAGVRSYAGIIVCRLFIGLGESIFGQAVVLHYSLWYKKDEIATRLALFIGAGVLAGAFGGLIAFGVSHIQSSIETWRILFLIEGIPSIVLGICVILFLPGRPDRSWLLTEEQKALQFRRLRSQNLDEGDDGIDWNGVKRAFTDWKAYVVTFIYSCMQLTLSSLSGFFPTIIKSLGYTNTQAQLFTVPPYAVAFGIMALLNSASDRVRIRGLFIMGAFTINAVGWLILLTVVHNLHVRYFACFCIVTGGYCTIPLIQSWVANNTGSQSQRAVQLGFLNSLANWAALTSPFIFPSKDNPRWPLGFGMNLAFSFAAILTAAFMTVWYRMENQRRDRNEGGPPLSGSKVEQAKLHDLAPGFRYTP